MTTVVKSEDPLLASKKRDIETLLRGQQFHEARAASMALCQHYSDDYDLWFNLGAINGKLGLFAAAEAAFLKALALRRDDPQIYSNLARLCDLQGRFEDELRYCQHFLRLRPNDGAAHSQTGRLLYRLGQLPEAEQALRNALRCMPDTPAYLNNLGIILHDLDRYDEALTCYQRVLALNPDMDEAYCNLGKLYQKKSNVDAAEEAYGTALKINPQNGDVYKNLGILLLAAGRNDEALRCFDERLRLVPECADAHWNRALLLLAAGNFCDGWREYEWRFRCDELRSAELDARHSSKVLWDGSVLTDKVLLVYAEQGFGDTLQFCRYLPLVMERVGHLVFESPPELYRLLSDSFKDIKFIQRQAGALLPDLDYDVQVPLLTLPYLFNTIMTSIPSAVPYIHADLLLVEYWRERITQDAFNVGIVWAGNQNYKGDRERSLSLTALGALGEVSGVRFYSLQKGSTALSAAPMPLIDLAPELESFATTAAVIANLDLVISVDTSVAHLAGAMGRPVWTLIYTPPDWRWLLDRDDSPWYPSMRLFRQSRIGEWGPVVERIAEALSIAASSH